jgi:RimJ/RimL family protein N-acetyltransferase
MCSRAMTLPSAVCEDRGVRLRPATAEDCRLIFGWRNDPFIIARGSKQTAVAWAEHSAWFAESLAVADRRRLFIVERGGVPVGLVRFDREVASSTTISVYLAQEHTGRGVGVAAIKAGCRRIREEWDVRRILALIRNDNAASLKAFVKAGFSETADSGRVSDHRTFCQNP